MKNYSHEYFTLTGLSLEEALLSLQAPLPPHAYKAIGGGSTKGFTDINPAWITLRLTEAFGPLGLGWTYSYEDVQVSTEVRTVKRDNGSSYERKEITALIPSFILQYVYADEEGTQYTSLPIQVTGGSKNEKPEDALKGAVTNALAHAASRLTFQLAVYMGTLTHDSSGTSGTPISKVWGSDRSVGDILHRLYYGVFPDLNQAPEEEAEPEEEEAEPEALVVKKEAPAPDPKPEPEPKVKEAPKAEEPKAAEVETSGDFWNLVVPANDQWTATFTGKTLDKLANNSGRIGKTFIQFLSGEKSQANGKKFIYEGNPELEALHTAAVQIVEAKRAEQKK